MLHHLQTLGVLLSTDTQQELDHPRTADWCQTGTDENIVWTPNGMSVVRKDQEPTGGSQQEPTEEHHGHRCYPVVALNRS